MRKIELRYDGAKSDVPFVTAFTVSKDSALFLKKFWLTGEESKIRKAKITKLTEKPKSKNTTVEIKLINKDVVVHTYLTNHGNLGYLVARVWCSKSFKKCVMEATIKGYYGKISRTMVTSFSKIK